MHERAVAGGFRDSQMKQSVSRQRLTTLLHLAIHLVERLSDCRDLRALGRFRCERRTRSMTYRARNNSNGPAVASGASVAAAASGART
jgi:hypothetical protein